MPVLTMAAGAVLVLVGIVGYVASDAASVTALIPAVLGLVLLVCGGVANRSESARRHAIHAALVVALLGALGSLRPVMDLPAAVSGESDAPIAAYASTATVIICVVLIVAGVRSFIAARKAREQHTA